MIHSNYAWATIDIPVVAIVTIIVFAVVRNCLIEENTSVVSFCILSMFSCIVNHTNIGCFRKMGEKTKFFGGFARI
jgi:hypothetical protein